MQFNISAYDHAPGRQVIPMNKNYERCTRCNRRKVLSTGCLRKWLKPMECKHIQRTLDNKRDLNDAGIVSCVVMSERTTPVSSNKFIKFWKNKLLISGSVTSLQRYFTNKVGGNDILNKPNTSTDKKLAIVSNSGNGKENEKKQMHQNCQHSEQSILRRHDPHFTAESSAIYCQLSKHGWYWGGITLSEAEELLAGQHDNVFLVRDSYSSRHLLCVSFRCVGRTLHARLRHANGLFSLNNETFVPVNRISEHCSTVDVTSQLFERPVRLARPLNRFAKLDSLQLICRFVIRQTVPPDSHHRLPLPNNLISYISLGTDYIPKS